MWKSFVAASAALAIAGCSAGADIGAGEEQVTVFHELYNGEHFDQIHSDAHEEFQRASTAAEFDQMMRAIRARLGEVRSTNRTGFHVNYTTGGSAVTLSYDSQFERGRAAETFIYRVDGERARLLNYNINSRDLIGPPPASEPPPPEAPPPAPPE